MHVSNARGSTRNSSREVAVGEERLERRGYPRFIIGTRTEGRTRGFNEAPLLNLSLGGAMIEHAQVVEPDMLSSLDLELQERRLSLPCRIVWSVVARQELDLDGKEMTVYRTGLEFLDPPEQTQQVISDYVQSMIEEKEIVPPN